MNINSIVQSLGLAGILLAILSVISFFICLKTSFFLFVVNRDFSRKMSMIETGAVTCADFIATTPRGVNPLVDIIIELSHLTSPLNDLKGEVSFLFHRNFSSVMRDVTWLRLISVIAPMLGFLGTLLGIVKLFQHIAEGNNDDLAILLASGIWEVLITTIAGIIVAVPALIFFFALTLWIKRLQIEAIEYTTHSLAHMSVGQSMRG